MPCTPKNVKQIHELLINPYRELIALEFRKAMDANHDISVISLIRDPELEKLTLSMGIQNFFIMTNPEELIEVNPPTCTMTGGFMEKDLLESSETLEAQNVLQTIAGTHIFVFDGLTFTGNRVRATLLWLLHSLGSQTKATVINMISSHRGLAQLAHSFTYVEFMTISELKELDGIWDLPAEGRFIRTILGQESV